MFDDNEFGNSNGFKSEEQELDEFFSGGGGPKAISWKDAKMQTSYSGIITKVELRDKRDKQGNVELNKYGKPKKIVILTLLTDLRDPEIEGDNGLRRMFLQGNAQWELRQALKRANAVKPLKGGRFKITLIGTKPTEHYNDQNLFQVLYGDPTGETLARVAAIESEANRVPAGDDDWGTSSQTAQPARAATTLDSMRGSGNFGDSGAPF